MKSRRRALPRRLVPVAVAAATVVALVLAIDPRGFAGAVRSFDLAAIPAVVALSMTYYLLQGLRWHPLLRAVGVPIRLRDTTLLNLAGQSTGLLPGGELTRAVLVSEVSGAGFGGVVATITVQELIYTLILIAAAVPGSLTRREASVGVIAALAGTVLVVVILTVRPVFARVLRVVGRVPVLRRYRDDVDDLHAETVVLLRRWDTLGWSTLSVLGALTAITLFWLVVHSVAPGRLSWQAAAFVTAVSNVAAAISLLPGGLGAYEASVTGLLVASGLPPGTAAAAAILQRVADKGLATVAGAAAYVAARRRLRFGPLRVGASNPKHASPRANRSRVTARPD